MNVDVAGQNKQVNLHYLMASLLLMVAVRWDYICSEISMLVSELSLPNICVLRIIHALSL